MGRRVRRRLRQRERRRAGVRPAQRVAAEQRVDDRRAGFRDMRRALPKRRRILVSATQPGREPVVALERQVPAEEQVEDAAERVHVGLRTALAAGRLLGRPVLRRPDQDAHRRERAAAPRDAREAEVGRDDPPGLALDEDVRRRKVAVDDALGVRVGERLAHRPGVGDGLAPRQREPAEGCLGEIAPLHELQDEERLFAGLRVVVDADDALVRQRGQRARLAREPPPLIALHRDERAQHLDRHVTIELRVAGAPDDAHGAFPDLLEQLVAACRDLTVKPYALFSARLRAASMNMSASALLLKPRVVTFLRSRWPYCSKKCSISSRYSGARSWMS